MPSIPVRFDSYYFGSIAEAKRAFKALRDRYVPDRIVTDPNDDRMIRALVDHHRNAAEKIGEGIEYFVVQINTSLGTRRTNYGIWIKQKGRDELVEFGYSKTLEWLTNPSNHSRERSRVDGALRNEIRSMTDAYLREEKRSGRALISAVSGLPLDTASGIDVVHLRPTWGELVDAFLTLVGGTSKIQTSYAEQSLGERLVEDHMRKAWLEFHRQAATLGLARPGERARRTANDEELTTD